MFIGCSEKEYSHGIVLSGRSVSAVIKNTFVKNSGNCGILWMDGATGIMETCLIDNCQLVFLYFFICIPSPSHFLTCFLPKSLISISPLSFFKFFVVGKLMAFLNE